MLTYPISHRLRSLQGIEESTLVSQDGDKANAQAFLLLSPSTLDSKADEGGFNNQSVLTGRGLKEFERIKRGNKLRVP